MSSLATSDKIQLLQLTLGRKATAQFFEMVKTKFGRNFLAENVFGANVFYLKSRGIREAIIGSVR